MRRWICDVPSSAGVSVAADSSSQQLTELEDLGVAVELLHGHLSVEANATEDCRQLRYDLINSPWTPRLVFSTAALEAKHLAMEAWKAGLSGLS